MRGQKKKRLEAAGWKVGSAAEFLRLSPEEAAVVELRCDLAAALRKERLRRRMTQEELRGVLGTSQSRVAKMEAGHTSVSLDLLLRGLIAMGATRREIAGHIGARRKRAA